MSKRQISDRFVPVATVIYTALLLQVPAPAYASPLVIAENKDDGPVLSWREPEDWPYVGGAFQLECRLAQEPKINIALQKIVMNATCPRCQGTSNQNAEIKQDRKSYAIKRIIIVENATLEDSGEYTCMWYKDGTLQAIEKKQINVAPRKHQIKVNNQSEVLHTLMQGNSLILMANISLYPSDTAAYSSQWTRVYRTALRAMDEIMETLIDDSHYSVQSSIVNGFTIQQVTIRNIQTNMSGDYVIKLTHGDTVRTLNYTVRVESKDLSPTLSVSPKSLHFFEHDYYYSGSNITAACFVQGHPPAKITLFKFSEHNKWVALDNVATTRGTFETGATAFLTALNVSEFKCNALRGNQERSIIRKIQLVESGPSVRQAIAKPSNAADNEDMETIYEGDSVSLTCRTPSEANWQLAWNFGDRILSNTSKIVGSMLYANLTLENATVVDHGTYTCIVSDRFDSHTLVVDSTTIDIIRAQQPKVLDSSNSSIIADYDSEVVLRCKFSGTPTPSVHWTKKGGDNSAITVNRGNGIEISEDGMQLKIMKLATKDGGSYECTGANRAGSATRAIDLTVEGGPTVLTLPAKLMIVLFILFLTFAICVLIKLYAGMRKTANDKQANLDFLYDQLMKGSTQPPQAPEGKEPLENRARRTAYTDHQAKYEIDEKCLILDDKSLGEGNFGFVRRGLLYKSGSSLSEDHGHPIPVAVKKAKRSSAGAIEGLIQELKILVALDEYAKGAPHPNVIAFIGASTSNLSKRGDLTVVLELCELGDLKNFLVASRPKFIDELAGGAETEDVDYLQPNSRRLLRNKSTPVPERKCDIGNEHGECVELLPESRDNSISTSDLVSFAMQVANGMKYLSAIPCIHRDLAARNILLTKNRVVKVADFGLTRIDPKSYYRVNKTKKLPIKTLALETLLTWKFTPETDVWSFGVLLYEIFTLGGNPYPGKSFDSEQLTSYLAAGHRMSRPPYCPMPIYNLMRQTWDENPTARPNFSQCHAFLKEHLKAASPTLLRKTEDDMRNAAKQIANYSDYRGEVEKDIRHFV